MRNRIYQNQFFLLAFICVTTFKVAMLPSLLSSVADINSIYSMAIMIILEAVMFILVYKISCNASIIEMGIPNSVKIPLLIFIFFSIFFKLNIFTIENCSYVSLNVFDKGSFYSILVITILTIIYISSKGLINIARLCEIIFWILLAAFLFNIIFASVNINFENIAKAKIDNTVVHSIDKYIIWFGDFTPFLFMTIVEPKKRTPFSVIGLIALIICPILLMIGFIGIYGSAGKYIDFAFSNLAIFNRFSEIIGSFDIPVIMAFLICAIIKISVMSSALIEIVDYFIKRKVISCFIVGGLLCLSTILIQSLSNSIKIATSNLRYAVAIIEYLCPIIILLIINIFNIKHKTIESKLSQVLNEE